MTSHVTIKPADLPHKNCSQRGDAEEIKKRYGKYPNALDIGDCFYCYSFRGVESNYPSERTCYLLCFEITPEDPSEAGGKIPILVE